MTLKAKEPVDHDHVYQMTFGESSAKCGGCGARWWRKSWYWICVDEGRMP